MRIGYCKIWRDVWRSKGRTLLAVLSIAIGVFAVGLVSGMNDFLPSNMTRSFRESDPAHLTIYLRSLIDDDVLKSLTRLPGVAGVEGALDMSARWRSDPNTPWRDANIVIRDDYSAQKFDRLELLSGQWPDRQAIAAERTTLSSFQLPADGTITLLIDDREHTFHIGGAVRDLRIYPPAFGGNATFYMSRDMAEALFGTRAFGQVKIQMPVFSQRAAEDTLQVVKNHLDKIGVGAGYTIIQDPNRHFNQDLVDAVTLILAVLAVLSLGLGLFLVINTINAIIAQQTTQIGMMKAVGATTGQVLRLYMSGVIFYSLLALFIAVPLGALATYSLSDMLLELLNVPVEGFRVSSPALTQQIGVGLLAPLLAGLWPVLAGVRITVREAISSYGIGTGYGRGILDRFLGHIRGLPRPMALTLRNTFRRKGRAVLTQITLIAAGVVFMMVYSVNVSFTDTIKSIFTSLGLDTFIGLNQTVRIEEAEALIKAQPGIAQVELRGFRTSTALRNADDRVGERIYVNGLPPDTQLFQPAIIEGRWLLPEDGHAIVLNQKLLGKLGLKVGDQVIIDMDTAGKSTWTIVGAIFDLSNNQANGYVPRDVFLREVGQVGRAGLVYIQTIKHDAASQADVMNRVRAAFESRGISVGSADTGSEQLAQSQNQFGILVTLLMVMATLIALVGSIGLAGTLSINVLERRREIGVMRAIGATSPTIASLFVGEGLTLGLLAWLLAVPLSMPIGNVFAQAISGVIKFDVTYEFSWQGAVIWLIVILVLSIVASVLPALRATRVSVRESLAYE